MSKSKCEAELEAMRQERDHWRSLAQQRTDQLRIAATEKAALRDALASQQDNAELFGGEVGLLNSTLRQRDEYRRNAEALKNDLDSMMNKYAQLEYILNPTRFANLEEMQNMTDEELKQVGGMRFHSATPALNVAYIVVARSPELPKPLFGQGAGMYFGTVEELRNEIQRFQQIVWRAPMPEDMRGSGMDAYGINRQQQLQAIQSLSLYVYDPDLRNEFGTQLDNVFRTQLEPDISIHLVSAAREAFRKSVKLTYDKLAENRGITLDLPKLTAGPKAKV